MKSGSHPYEKWSRAEYRAAYEEADGMLKKVVEERNALQERMKRFEDYQKSNQLWMRHSIILGVAIDRLLATTPTSTR